jgi:hypothetical protein
MSKLLLPFAFLMAVAVACSGGGGQADLTDRDITDEELSAMVLPQSDLGPDYEDFELDDESGIRTNEDVIGDAFERDDETQDIDRFGRIKGWQESYTLYPAFMKGEGTFGVGTSVDLYRDADGASGSLKDDLEDWQRAVGKTYGDMTVEAGEQFEVADVGDEALGVLMPVSLQSEKDTTMSQTVVAFRKGNLIGAAFVQAYGGTDATEEAIALGRKLDERIGAVLDGEVAPKPLPTAEPTEEPSSGVAPSDVLHSFRFSNEISVETDGSLMIASEGEFEAPDRLRCSVRTVVNGASFGTGTVVIIGPDAWLDEGDGFEAFTADDPEVVDGLDLCAGSRLFWEDYDFTDNSDAMHEGPVMKNGVEANVYAQALDGVEFVPSALEGLTFNDFVVWVAEDGGWPVAFEMDYLADAEVAADMGLSPAGDSQQLHATVRADITDANDADIHVEPPTP